MTVNVVLVDRKDRIVGYKEKYEAHHNPVPLHRAISVVIFDKDNQKMLIHQRSEKKVTWPLYWSNACCTHPRKNESYKKAAERRLYEEMGFKTSLKESFRFIYKAKYDETWGEHEYDVVFTGNHSGKVSPNSDEVSDFKWISLERLKDEIKLASTKFTPWFRIIIKRLI